MPRAPSIPATERRAHAVRALLELAAGTAPDQISTAAIAERMGISHAALFRHFPSRDALWAEAVHWACGELEQRFAAIDADLADPLIAVEELLMAHAGFLQAHPGLLRMLYAELQRPATSPAREEGRAMMDRFRSRLSERLGQAQRQGTIRPDLHASELAALLVALHQGLSLQGMAHGTLPQLTERCRGALALLLQGGGAPVAEAGRPSSSTSGTTARNSRPTSRNTSL